MGARAFALVNPNGAESIRVGRDSVATGPAPIRSALIGELRETIARIEDRQLQLADDDPDIPANRRPRFGHLRFGIAELDLALGGRLPVAALHEVRAADAGAATSAIGFALLLAGLGAGFGRPVFWIAEDFARGEAGCLYGPGLAALGLDPGLLVRVGVRRLDQALWAAGEIAAAGAGACLMEIRGNPARAGLAFTRRLALSARDSGQPVILLRQEGGEEAGAAASRWAIRPAVSAANAAAAAHRWLGPPAFAVNLEKCRGGRPGSWILEWNCHERRFALAQPGNVGPAADRAASAGNFVRASALSVA